MKKVLGKVKESKGFVSLETIAIAVIVIAIAAFIMVKFKGTASETSTSVDNQIKSTVNHINDEAQGTSGVK